MNLKLHQRIAKIHKLSWAKKLDSKVIAGLSGVILCLLSIGSLYLTTIPYKYLGGDSVGHIDYAWQVYHGRLPKFKDGTQAPFIPHRNVQFVSQHPPLYYTLIAPTIGYNFSRGHFNRAILSARFITLLIASVSIVAFSWAGWVFGGEKKAQFAVALPALIISFVPFVKISSLIMNDIMVVLASVICMTLSGLIILKGPTRRLIMLLAVFSLIGMSSRATFLATLAPSLLALIVGIWLHSKKSLVKKLQDSMIVVFIEIR